MSFAENITLFGDVLISDYASMSQTEQEEAILGLFENLPIDEQEALRDRLLELVTRYRDTLDEFADDAGKLSRNRRLSDDVAGDAARWVEEANELLMALTDFEGDLQGVVGESIQHEQTHNRSALNGEEVAVTGLVLEDSSVDQDHYTYTYKLGGLGDSASVPGLTMDEDADLSDEAWLVQEGITNEDGEVIVGTGTYAEIEAALRQRHDPLLNQMITFQLEPGQTVTYMDYDTVAGIIVLKVQDENGKVALVRLEGAFKVAIYFSGANLPHAEILRTWPPELLKQCYVNGNEKSLHVQLFDESISEEERLEHMLEHMRDYRDVRDDWSESRVYRRLDRGDNTGELDAAKEIVRRLFVWLDEGNLTPDRLQDVWEEIDAMLDEKGFGSGSESRAHILQRVIYQIAIKAPRYLPQFFGTGAIISRVENELENSTVVVEGGTELSAESKLAILLLETKAGIGQYGGEEIWNTYFPEPALGIPTTDTWNDEESRDSGTSLEALNNYKTIVTTFMDGDPGHRFNDILHYVETGEDPLASGDPATDDPSVGDENGEVTITITTDVYNEAMNYDDFYLDGYDDGDEAGFEVEETTLDTFKELIQDLFERESMPISEAREKITAALEELSDNPAEQSELAALIIVFFYTKQEFYNLHLFDALTGDEAGLTWANKMKGYLDASGSDDRPPHYSEAWGYLTGATRGREGGASEETGQSQQALNTTASAGGEGSQDTSPLEVAVQAIAETAGDVEEAVVSVIDAIDDLF